MPLTFHGSARTEETDARIATSHKDRIFAILKLVVGLEDKEAVESSCQEEAR